MTSRAEAIAFVAATLSGPLATAGLATTDTPATLGTPLDAAERAMTFAPIPVADILAREAAFMALVRYHVLLRVRDEVATRFDIGTGGDSYRLSQSLAGIEKLIADAREAAIFLAGSAAVAGGLPAVTTGAGDSIGGIYLDWSGASDGPVDEYSAWIPRW